jgi:hypothetical protein
MTVVALLVFLVGPGLYPAWASARSWPIAIVLAPLVTALACGVAAIVEVATGLGLLVCAVPVVLALNALAWRWSRGWRPSTPESSLLPALAITAAAMVMLIPLVRPAIDWDARATWFRLARWLAAGGSFTQHALGNKAYPFNRDYPPFSAATVAAFWKLGAGIDDRAGQLIVGVLNASAAVVTALAFPRLFRRARLGVVPTLMGMAFVVAAFGISKQYGTDGYQDLLWALTAVGATLYLLVAPVERRSGAIGLVLLLATVLTKNDASAVAVVIALAAGYRYRAELRRNPAILALVPLLFVWPILARHFGTVNEYQLGSIVDFLGGDATLWKRFNPTLDGMQPYLLLPALLTLGTATLGTFTIVSARRKLGLNDSWMVWLVWAAMAGSLVLAYVIADSTLSVHLQSSVDRTTTAGHLLLLAELALWTLTAMAFLVARRPRGHHSSRPAPEIERPIPAR